MDVHRRNVGAAADTNQKTDCPSESDHNGLPNITVKQQHNGTMVDENSSAETETILSNRVIFVFMSIMVTVVTTSIVQDCFFRTIDRGMFVYSLEDVKEYSFGSTDLLTEDLKRTVLDRVSHNPETLQDLKRELKEERMKFGGVSYMTIDAEELKGRSADHNQFIVIFDAGSTGTRVHILEFQVDGSALKLESEVFRHVKPGLSEFVGNPNEAVANIYPLVQVAMETVPHHLHNATPLIFKATAGLRLLDPVGAGQLLSKMRELMSNTDFSYDSEDISIMGGVEEGLYGWITVNYLLGHLDMDCVTAATLDLGGGSIQVTHEPVHLDDEMLISADDLKWLEMFGNDFHLYTHSYLGHGLKAARNNTFKIAGDGVLISDCLPVGYTGIFHYNGVDYSIRGPNERTLAGCWQQVGEFLKESHLMDVADYLRNPQTPDVYLFSYFYDIMVWAKVIKKSETEKVLTLHDYYQAAKRACQASDPSDPFLCQDLTYITRMLGEVFMLWDKPLHVLKKINLRETSWAVGAALGALSSQKQTGDKEV